MIFLRNITKILIVFSFFILLISNLSFALETSASSLNYVYSYRPDSQVIGSQIGFINSETIYAPVISFNFEENSYSSFALTVLTENNINLSGTACVLDPVDSLTWNNVLDSLTPVCKDFNVLDNNISISFNNKINTDKLLFVLIPNSGTGDSDIDSASISLTASEIGLEPEPESVIPDEEEIAGEEIKLCDVSSMSFNDESKFIVNQLVKLNLNTQNCIDSVIRVKIYEKTLTGKTLISNKQVLIDEENKNILWIPKKAGDYFFEVYSKNTLTSEVISVEEYSVDKFVENKEFYEVVRSVHDVADVDKIAAQKLCDDLKNELKKDVCFDDLAYYLEDKRICSKISDKERKDACYTAFAVQGDVSVCAHSNTKVNCMLLALVSRKSAEEGVDFSYPGKKDQSNNIIMENNKINSVKFVLIALLILAALIFLILNVYYEYKNKKKK
jgi:hypothetical protein